MVRGTSVVWLPVSELDQTLTFCRDRLGLQDGLRWDPRRSLALAGGAQYAKRLLMPLTPDRLRFIPRARAAGLPRAGTAHRQASLRAAQTGDVS